MQRWIALLLVLVACGAGCAPIGTVRLRAVDAVGGEPLADASIERQVPKYQPHIPLCYPVPCYFPSIPGCETHTVNSDGQVDFPNAFTDQRFLVSAPGYDPVLVDGVFPWTTARNWRTGETVSTRRRGGVITVSLPRAMKLAEAAP